METELKTTKKPIICITQPIDKYFGFQIHLYVESCIQAGFDEDRIHVLMYVPKGRDRNMEMWDKIQACYPKLKFFFYEDKGVQQYLGLYIPILRPHCLWQHFEANPWLKNETILYTDCDILWIDGLDIAKYFDDDVCYISDAASYLNVSYFESKTRDVLPEKLEEYKTRDILKELCDIVGIDKQIVIDNNNNTGGVQYILKNIDADFWKKVERDVISIRRHLYLGVNKQFYENESKGWQSWCADLWAILYNLWYFKKEVKVVPEMAFAWAPDHIDKLKTHKIYHNAGIVGETQDNYPCFYKGKYHQGNDPMVDTQIDIVLNNEISKKHCTWYYAKKLDELRKKYKLKY